MNLTVHFESFGETPGAMTMTARRGCPLLIDGWAIDADRSTPMSAVHGIIDGVNRVPADLTGKAFHIVLKTQRLAVGEHEFGMLLQIPEGSFVDTGLRIKMHIVEAENLVAGEAR